MQGQRYGAGQSEKGLSTEKQVLGQEPGMVGSGVRAGRVSDSGGWRWPCPESAHFGGCEVSLDGLRHSFRYRIT